MAQDQLAGGGESRGIRCVRHELDGAAHRPRAVQRALRPPQDLDAIQVIEVRIDDHLAVLRRRRRGERRVVQIKSDRGRVAAGRGHAAHLELGLARTAGSHGHAGHRLHDRLDVRDAAILQLLPGDGGDADRRGLDRRLALGRGHDDFLQRVAAGLRGGRGLLLGACARRDEQTKRGSTHQASKMDGRESPHLISPFIDICAHGAKRHAAVAIMLQQPGLFVQLNQAIPPRERKLLQ